MPLKGAVEKRPPKEKGLSMAEPGQVDRDRNTHLLLTAWKVLLESRRKLAKSAPSRASG